MAIRFKDNGCLYKAYVKDKELYVEFSPQVVVKRPLPFVKEDFMINYTFPISNVALLLESDSGNILIAWFTGGMSIYQPLGNKWRLMAHTNFNIYTFRDDIADVLDNGAVQSRLQVYVTRTHIHSLQTLFLKDYPGYAVLDIPDRECGFLINVDMNLRIVREIITGAENYPGFQRGFKTLSLIGSDGCALVAPYIIEQPEGCSYTFNL